MRRCFRFLLAHEPRLIMVAVAERDEAGGSHGERTKCGGGGAHSFVDFRVAGARWGIPVRKLLKE
jgi:hypothetical protein